MSGGLGVGSLCRLAVDENHIADRPSFRLASLSLWSQVAAACHLLCSAVPADAGAFPFPDEIVHKEETHRDPASRRNEE